MKVTNAQHSSESPLWYTRAEHMLAVREVLGTIDLDPASDEVGNLNVGALRFIAEQENGLRAPWHKTVRFQKDISVYMNPPGGKEHNRSLPVLFWERLHDLRVAGRLRHAIVAAFSIEQFQTTQHALDGCPPMLAFPFCVPRTRVKWVPRAGQVSASPTHSSAFVYVPGNVDATELFIHAFSSIGRVVVPVPD